MILALSTTISISQSWLKQNNNIHKISLTLLHVCQSVISVSYYITALTNEIYDLSQRINNEWSFDDSIANYGCQVFSFDPSMQQKDHFHSPYVQFFRLGLAHVDSEGKPREFGKLAWKTRTLKSIINNLRHEKVLNFIFCFLCGFHLGAATCMAVKQIKNVDKLA